jgi:hypothetical protein
MKSHRTAHSDLRKRPRSFLLNLVIVVLVVAVGYLGYALFLRQVVRPPVDVDREGGVPGEIIQIDVLNGCGAAGVASTFTAYLRARRYDVVEMRNYKTFDVDESMVIDRVGNLENAGKVAYALGIGKSNIIQQLNPGYYVDVSVVIGKDYQTLKPMK